MLEAPLPRIIIVVDGLPGDTEDLYQVLRSTRLPRGSEITPISGNDGTLGVVETIAAAVSSLAALGSLAVAIGQWKSVAKASVRVELEDGKVIALDNPDPEAIEQLWNLVQGHTNPTTSTLESGENG